MNRLNASDWSVTTADVAVPIGQDLRYPDVLVDRISSGDLHEVSTTTATFIAEVLSPSSLPLDLGVKAREFTSLPSLRTYLVLAQDEPHLWIWERDEDGAFPKQPVMIEGFDASVQIDGLAISLPASEIFRALSPPK